MSIFYWWVVASHVISCITKVQKQEAYEQEKKKQKGIKYGKEDCDYKNKVMLTNISLQ